MEKSTNKKSLKVYPADWEWIMHEGIRSERTVAEIVAEFVQAEQARREAMEQKAQETK